MKRKIIFSLVCFIFFLLMPVSMIISQEAAKEEASLDFEQQRLKMLYPNTSFKYRGLISGDIASGDSAHELMADFGSKGVWFLGGASGSWHMKSPDDPDYIISADLDGDGDIEIIGDFGSKGLWYFDYDMYGGSWNWMTSDTPTNIIATDDDDDGKQELHADFGSKGLWRYKHGSGWYLLTGDDAGYYGLHSDFWTPGVEETIWNFSSGVWAGWWNPYTSSPMWDFMTGDYMYDDNVAAELGVGDNSEEVVLDFYTKGLWAVNKESGSESWVQLSPNDPYDIRAVRWVGNLDYELVAQFGSPSGLWTWNAVGGSFPGSWTLLTSDNASFDEAFIESFDPNGTTETNGDEEFAADFGSKGLWLYDFTSSSWTKMSPDSPRFMVRSDLLGNGVDDCLICDFDSKGLWYYKGSTGTWIQLSPDSPEPN